MNLDTTLQDLKMERSKLDKAIKALSSLNNRASVRKGKQWSAAHRAKFIKTMAAKRKNHGATK